MHNTAYVALGSNLPHAGATGPALLARAVAAMQSAGLRPRALSGIWQTAAWPQSDQPDYCNAVAELDPQGLPPQPLYQRLCEIEARFGRTRREKWAARTLDLDLLALNDLLGRFGDIVLPHPHMHERAFVLAPLGEIASDWRHPLLMKTAPELLAALPTGYRYRRIGDFPAWDK
jgi:2-amino-4-hydroxy-6-hydroxymethyldihydropteridine diphosphokinase